MTDWCNPGNFVSDQFALSSFPARLWLQILSVQQPFTSGTFKRYQTIKQYLWEVTTLSEEQNQNIIWGIVGWEVAWWPHLIYSHCFFSSASAELDLVPAIQQPMHCLFGLQNWVFSQYWILVWKQFSVILLASQHWRQRALLCRQDILIFQYFWKYFNNLYRLLIF